MNIHIITVILLTVSLMAREEMFLSQECPAFNNMKHTQNTDDVYLDIRLGFER